MNENNLRSSKLEQLGTTNQMLNEKYGMSGAPERADFDAKAIAWYYGSILRERCRKLKLTQRQVVERVGSEQTYIARVERGKADVQLFNYLRIAAVLGLPFIPTILSANG